MTAPLTSPPWLPMHVRYPCTHVSPPQSVTLPLHATMHAFILSEQYPSVTSAASQQPLLHKDCTIWLQSTCIVMSPRGMISDHKPALHIGERRLEADTAVSQCAVTCLHARRAAAFGMFTGASGRSPRSALGSAIARIWRGRLVCYGQFRPVRVLEGNDYARGE